MFRRAVQPLLFAVAFLAVFVATASYVLAEGRYKIVTTIGMITDATKNVAGQRAQVQGLMGSGVDPHLYKPTRSDIAKLMQADVVFYNGLLLEGKLTDALIRVASAGKKVYPVTALLSEEYLLEPAEFQGHFDPHVWMDPSAWSKAIEVIRDKLIEHDPEGAEIYNQNARNYLEQLNDLDAYASRSLKSIPLNSRVLVTAHDAFNYFGRRYDFEVLGIQGVSTESEAGVKDIERIVDILVARKVRSVFVESTVSERNIKALIEGAHARGHQVQIGGELFSDAMGAQGSYEGTYLGMIDHNVTTISAGLGGEVKPAGWQGLLASAGKLDRDEAVR